MEGKSEEEHSFAHQCIWDQNQEYLFVVNQARLQGYGMVKVFRFDVKDGSLTETDTYYSREYDEPRLYPFIQITAMYILSMKREIR